MADSRISPRRRISKLELGERLGVGAPVRCGKKQCSVADIEGLRPSPYAAAPSLAALSNDSFETTECLQQSGHLKSSTWISIPQHR